MEPCHSYGYVLSLSNSAHDPIKAELGKSKFAACMACHGPGGVGNQALGAPNLSDKIWLYGGSEEQIELTLRDGRNGKMPAFGNTLSEDKIHIVTAYIYGTSRQQ